MCVCHCFESKRAYTWMFASHPQTLGSLVALTSLSAQHNKISELPKEIGELCQLRNLKLHDNQIEHLPPTFGQLVRAPPSVPRE